jgi:hypothetical protein
MIVIESKLAEVLARSLNRSKHSDIEKGMCAMEAVSYVAGEPWSDHPVCACPVISSFLRSWNDSLPSDAERDRLLKPLISQLVDSKSTAGVEERRSYLALDWLVRVFTPKFLDLVPTLASHAAALRDLEEIADMAGAVAAGKVTAAAGAAAWAAARAAAGAAAARDAARDAARAAAGAAAAWAAAWAAARAAAGAAAARDAARDAARAAAGAAAWDAAGDEARAALKPTVEWLQMSALDLVDRMLAVTPLVSMGVAA